jgi:hypothetical protein
MKERSRIASGGKTPPALEAIVGAQLNSFGFYATDVFSGHETNFDWVVDDLVYGGR